MWVELRLISLIVMVIIENELLLLPCAIFVFIYLWFQYVFSYWSIKGIFCPETILPFGNIRDAIQGKSHFFQLYCDNYFKFKHIPYIGMFCFHKPVLSLHNLEIIKRVMINDFEYFQSHGVFSDVSEGPSSKHLFNLHGQAWKKLRNKLTPTFTSHKLKSVYPLVEEISNQALVYVDEAYLNGESINFTEFYEKYNMEITANVGFGVICDGFNNPDSEFYLRGREYFGSQTIYWSIIRSIAFLAPNIFRKLRLNLVDTKIISFFSSMVHETVIFRNKHDYKRNDYLQSLIDLKAEQTNDKDEFTFTMTDLVSNAILYMLAGYETSATTGQLAAYELACNPHIQDKVRAEVRRVLAKYDGQCTYEAQNEMVYLNMIMDETLRKHPPLRVLFRECTKDYKMPGTNLMIDKGTTLFIPIHAIHMDPELFPNPEVFDPERFSPANKAKLHPCQWMPFGEGPRKCLGLRQGYIQSKIALLKVLNEYQLLLDEQTQVPLKLKKSSLAYSVEGGIWIKLRKL